MSTKNTTQAFIVSFLAFLVYFFSLPPTITGEDAGELITAAYTLGIPHPPGYPLWCMAAHPFTWLPWGSVAWRVHLSSAVFAALTVGLLAWLLQCMTRNRIAAVAGALALAFSREFWEQAIIAEVYALNALCLMGCIALLWQWQQTRNTRWLWAFAVLYGLSLGNHNTMHLLAPVFALWVFWVDGKPWQNWHRYIGMALCALLAAFAVYAYLPLRSLANPSMDWGNPETLSNWLRHVRRDQYAFMLTENPRSWGRFLWQMGAMGRLWLWEFTPWIGGISILGIVGLYRNSKSFALFLIAVSLLTLSGFTLIQNFNDDREWLTVMSVFGIPAYLATAIFIGWAIHSCQSRWGRKLAIPLAMLAVLSPLYWNQEHNYRAEDYWTEDYLRNVLGNIAPEGVFIPTMDHATFGTIYMQEVEGFRPDITLGRRYGYIDLALADGMPKEKLDIYGEFPPRRYDDEIIAWVLEHTDRPVYVDTYTKLEHAPEVRCGPAGVVYRLLRPGETDNWDYWAAYQWHSDGFGDTRRDYTADLILGQLYFAKARDAFADGDSEAGYRNLEYALYATGRDALFLNQAGVTAARGKNYKLAATYFDAAYALRPWNDEIADNHSRIHQKLKD